jgi:SAM-dependent methyltransferase
MSTATGTAAIQGPLWGARANEWSKTQAQRMRPLHAEVARVTVKTGMDVLDIGCGSGEFLQIAAEQRAKVSGLDAAAGLLAIARERVPSGDLRQGEMTALPWAGHTFDLVTGFNVFQYAHDFVQALREARRVAKPGAEVVIALWGKDEDCEAVATIRALALLLPPPPPGAPGPLALGQDGLVERLAIEAGLKPGVWTSVDCPWIYADLETALRATLSAGPMIRAVNHSGEEAVRAAEAEALKPFRLSDGSYRMENQFRYMITTARDS